MFVVRFASTRRYSDPVYLNNAGRRCEYGTRTEAVAAAETFLQAATSIDSVIVSYTIVEVR